MKFEEVQSTKYGKAITDDIPIKPEFDEIDIRDFYIPMSDGTKLLCHGAFPVGAESLPVILTRTPYGRQSLRFFFEMSFYGYICIAQNCRGCFGSEGEWVPAKHERSDGIDTLNYIKNQPFCNKNIAMTGTSYLSMNQYLICDCLPAEVKALNLEVYSPYRHDLLYTNGMYHLEAYSGWTAYNCGIKTEKTPDELYEKMIYFNPQMYADENVLGRKLDWYRQWLKGSEPDDDLYKTGAYGSLYDMPKAINVPVLVHAGWYDPHFGGMIRAWEHMKNETREKSAMIITPTNHKQALCSDIDTPNAFDPVGIRFIRSKLNWFGHHLKGKDYFQPVNEGSVTAYVYGENKYKIFKGCIKDHTENTLYIDTKNRKLSKYEIKNQTCSEYIYDPENPVSTCGSEVIMTDYMYHKHKKTTEGRRIQPSVGYRKDVISFVSDKFEKDLLVNGNIIVTLDISSSAEDTCFYVKLSTVNENDNTALYLRSGITTLKSALGKYTPNSRKEITITFNKIAVSVKKGEKFRLDITSSDYPAFNIHPNTTNLWSEETKPVKAVQKLYGGKIEF